MIRYSPKFKQVIIQGQSNTFYGFQSQKFKKKAKWKWVWNQTFGWVTLHKHRLPKIISGERTSEKSEGLNDPQPKVPNISWRETVIIIKVLPCILEDDVDCSIYWMVAENGQTVRRSSECFYICYQTTITLTSFLNGQSK